MENTDLCRQEILKKLNNGYAFYGTHTTEIEYCEPLFVDNKNNTLRVICMTNTGYPFESEFELDQVLNGFEIDEYRFLDL